jgi:hypothetical protein
MFNTKGILIMAIQRYPDDGLCPYIMILRHIIQDPNISPEAKGYYAEYVSESIEWLDIPEKFRQEINSIPVYKEVNQ